MESLDNIFTQVLTKFTTRLTKQELEDFKFSSLDDVLKTVHSIQKEQGRRKEMMNLTRIQSFLEAMGQYGQVIEVFLNASSILCFVWGPMKFCLQNIPLFRQYQQLFGSDLRMASVLATIYEDILDFHQVALRVFKQSTWRNLFKSAWKDFQTTFKHILEDLARHKRLIESQGTLIELQEAQASRAFSREQFHKSEEAHREKRYLDVLNWLSAADSIIDQEAALKVRKDLPMTGQWILRDPKVKTWLDPTSSLVTTLWMNGIPGAGKTILSSVVVAESLRINDVTTIYFYCSYQDAQRKTFLAVAKSLLAQLLNKHREQLLPYLHDKLINSGQVTLVSSELIIECLQVCLKTTTKTYIVIDGLDECDAHDRNEILSFFLSSIDKVDTPGQLRAFIVSQDLNDIRKALRTTTTVKLTEECNKGDIKSYSIHWIQKIRARFAIPDDMAEYIQTTVLDRADALSIDIDDQTVNSEANRLCRDVRDICGSLVDIVPGGRVQLVHSTAKHYLIHNNFVQIHLEECKLAVLCLQYLLFDCFDINLSEEKAEAYIRQGNYAFQDYAILHWIDHMEASIPHLPPDSSCDDLALGAVVKDFEESYGSTDLDIGDVSYETKKKFTHLEASNYYSSLMLLLHHTRMLRRKEESFKGLGDIGASINKNRSILENLVTTGVVDQSQKHQLEQYYGARWFKCPRHACPYFYKGFADLASRESHLVRHEKPYVCTYPSCPRTYLGFSTDKELKKHICELKKHMAIMHPDPAVLFPKVKKAPAKHVCDVCSKDFTRAHNLNAHKRTHGNIRPYKCNLCEKSFVRKYDCERHANTLHPEGISSQVDDTGRGTA
ncbi:hypothetical protein DL95DRAFT_508617 [Leptodontidium sp. 2 PMI_412]|nr:hypothetical protein DL95DRAFT_508617 [Leptodontidium sp. 2 PMI_412]